MGLLNNMGNLIPSRISDYIHFKVWGEIAYPSPNFNGGPVEVWELKRNFIPHFTWHLSIQRLKSIHISKRGLWSMRYNLCKVDMKYMSKNVCSTDGGNNNIWLIFIRLQGIWNVWTCACLRLINIKCCALLEIRLNIQSFTFAFLSSVWTVNPLVIKHIELCCRNEAYVE